MDGGDLCEADADDLCASDGGKLATAHSQTAMLPPRFSESSLFSRNHYVRLPCCIPAKGEKAPTFPVKFVACLEAESSDLLPGRR